jgi:hypothetical protein
VSIDKARIERICAARFPSWEMMGAVTKDKYRRQAAFWAEAVDRADGETVDEPDGEDR